MSTFNFKQITERFLTFWNNFLKRVDEEGTSDYSREKIVVFFVALMLALCLWFLVNLSRSYILNLNLPIILGNIPDDKALAENLPDFATVSVQGEGWKLINLYNNPPRIFVDVTNGEVNLLDQVRQQMNAIPEINVQKVQPLMLSLDLEDRVSKKVPVSANVSLKFDEQFNLVSDPYVSPDSITVSGASSIIDTFSFWETDSVMITNVKGDISASIGLKQPRQLVTISRSAVQYNAEVAEFTEGESKVFIRIRNLPRGQNITFSPTFVTIRYTIPIEEYTDVKNLNPFTAYVPYKNIQQDSTGFVTPQMEVSAGKYHIKLQSHQPAKVAYFIVVDGNTQ